MYVRMHAHTHAHAHTRTHARTHTHTHTHAHTRAHTHAHTRAQIQAYVLDIKHLEIGDPIAQGVFGQIYRGTYDQQDVAVKTLIVKDDATKQQVGGWQVGVEIRNQR